MLICRRLRRRPDETQLCHSSRISFHRAKLITARSVDGLSPTFFSASICEQIPPPTTRSSPHPRRPAANLPLVPVGILEKHGVISRRIIVAILRPLDGASPRLHYDLSQPVNLFLAVRPESDAIRAAPMPAQRFQPHERCVLPASRHGVPPLILSVHDLRQSQRRKSAVIKFPRLREIGNPHVNVIKKMPSHVMKDQAKRSALRLATQIEFGLRMPLAK